MTKFHWSGPDGVVQHRGAFTGEGQGEGQGEHELPFVGAIGRG